MQSSAPREAEADDGRGEQQHGAGLGNRGKIRRNGHETVPCLGDRDGSGTEERGIDVGSAPAAAGIVGTIAPAAAGVAAATAAGIVSAAATYSPRITSSSDFRLPLPSRIRKSSIAPNIAPLL
jgi:hypothetical protein